MDHKVWKPGVEYCKICRLLFTGYAAFQTASDLLRRKESDLIPSFISM